MLLCEFGPTVKKGTNPWDNLDEGKSNPRLRKYVLPDQTEKKKEELTLCCLLEESNSLKSQQRTVRLGIMSNISEVEHITLKDSSFSANKSLQEHTRHISLRSNTGLAGSALGREFGERIFWLLDIAVTHWRYKVHLTCHILTNISNITPLSQNFCLVGYYRSAKGWSKNPYAGWICSALSQQHQIVCNSSG